MNEAGVDRVVIVPPSWGGLSQRIRDGSGEEVAASFCADGRLRLDILKSKDLLAT
jgi:hypothetical protein